MRWVPVAEQTRNDVLSIRSSHSTRRLNDNVMSSSMELSNECNVLFDRLDRSPVLWCVWICDKSAIKVEAKTDASL